ncbi:beta-N-acetylhexosaminidase family protein, partial [Actinomyces slackii]
RIVKKAGGTVVTSGATARIVVGTADGKPVTQGGLTLDVPTQAEGYALATVTSGVPTAVAVGADADGAFYATTVLEQLTIGGSVTGALIKDWPTMPVRGMVEGFYGIPWSHQARMDIMSYMGAQRMNTYIYAPKDDPYLRAKWRELYPAAELERMKALGKAAQAAHLDLVVTLSPGDSICYSSDEDYKAAVAVFEQLRGIGIKNFYVAFDDTTWELGCDSDKAAFTGAGELEGLAQAQAHFLNRIQRDYIKAKGLPDLWTVPTQYTGTEATVYKTTLGKALDNAVAVQWTGISVVTDSITTAQATQAAANYGTDRLVIWDNFPANDGENQARLFLGPMPAREATLGSAITGITTNPMIQPYASRLALAEYASFTWHPAKHDAQATRDKAIAEIVGKSSGTEWETMQAFIDVQEQWEFTGWQATDTWNDIYRFIWALEGSDEAWLEAKAATLRARLRLLRNAPTTLEGIAATGFYTDTKPWMDVTSNWASADLAAIDLLLALRRGDTQAAQKANATMESMVTWTTKGRVNTLDDKGNVVTNGIVPKVGENAMSELVDQARTAWANR